MIITGNSIAVLPQWIYCVSIFKKKKSLLFIYRNTIRIMHLQIYELFLFTRYYTVVSKPLNTPSFSILHIFFFSYTDIYILFVCIFPSFLSLSLIFLLFLFLSCLSSFFPFYLWHSLLFDNIYVSLLFFFLCTPLFLTVLLFYYCKMSVISVIFASKLIY